MSFESREVENCVCVGVIIKTPVGQRACLCKYCEIIAKCPQLRKLSLMSGSVFLT